MGKILLVLASLVLAGCNDSAPQQAVTISQDYQDSQHAINNAIFERERLARALHREALLSQH